MLRVCRSAAGLRRPSDGPTTTQEEVVAPESLERPKDTPSSAVNVEVPKTTSSVDPLEPSSQPAAAPPASELADPSSLRVSSSIDTNEVPIGLIEDDLLSAELCDESVDSLRHVYKHFKVMFYNLHCALCV